MEQGAVEPGTTGSEISRATVANILGRIRNRLSCHSTGPANPDLNNAIRAHFAGGYRPRPPSVNARDDMAYREAMGQASQRRQREACEFIMNDDEDARDVIPKPNPNSDAPSPPEPPPE